jgi:TatD DNase family protein
MLIDTHAHLNFNAFKDDADKVIRRCLENNLWTINVGTKYETSKKAVELAQKYKEGVFAALGLHPIHLETGLVKIKNDTEEIEIKTTEQDFDYKKYKELAKNPKVVAVGEIGLDYYWKPKTKKKLELFKEKQRSVLCQQLDLAKELNLPVILHCRLAHDDLINELRIADYEMRGVIHCFTGNWQQAQKFLEMGFYLGFNGIIFKKIEGIDFAEVIKNTPLDRILLETDCPYLTPPQAEGRNEPLNIKYVAQEIAKIKNLEFNKIAEAAADNAKVLFKLDKSF